MTRCSGIDMILQILTSNFCSNLTETHFILPITIKQKMSTKWESGIQVESVSDSLPESVNDLLQWEAADGST